MMAMFKNGGLAAMLLLGAGLSSAYAAEVTHSVDPDNGLQGWHFSSGDIEIELIQRLPDQTRAMFMKHAFSREVIEQLALSCIFQTIIRNTGKSGSGQAVSVDLAQWRLRHDGATGGILLKEPLLASWSDEQASPAAKLVVRWGMFPTQQDFLPGDYNWGMTAYGLPPGAVFDLEVNWKEADMQHSGEIGGVLCAPDVDKLK
jgi:hypothetical protein